MSPERGPLRQRDDGRWLCRFSARMLVVCPRCGGRAVVTPPPSLPPIKTFSQLLFRERRLICPQCAVTATWRPDRRGAGHVGVSLGGSEDPFFGRPLWLQTRCVGRI